MVCVSLCHLLRQCPDTWCWAPTAIIHEPRAGDRCSQPGMELWALWCCLAQRGVVLTVLWLLFLPVPTCRST